MDISPANPKNSEDLYCISEIRGPFGNLCDNGFYECLRDKTTALIAREYKNKGIYSGELPEIEKKINDHFMRYKHRVTQLSAYEASYDPEEGCDIKKVIATISLFLARDIHGLPSAVESNWNESHKDTLESIFWASGCGGSGVGEIGKFATDPGSRHLAGMAALYMKEWVFSEAYFSGVGLLFLSTSCDHAKKYASMFGFQEVPMTLHRPESVGKKECVASYAKVERPGYPRKNEKIHRDMYVHADRSGRGDKPMKFFHCCNEQSTVHGLPYLGHSL